jgi:hypothetical protein
VGPSAVDEVRQHDQVMELAVAIPDVVAQQRLAGEASKARRQPDISLIAG